MNNGGRRGEEGFEMKHLLFVTKDAETLSAIEHVQHSHGLDWAIEIVDDPKAARLRMGSGDLDFVFVDVNDPELLGLVLLREARGALPQTIRVAMAPSMNGATAMQAATVAHQFLEMPYSPRILVDTIVRALRVHLELQSDSLRAIVGRIQDLPAAPSVFLSLTEALADPEVDLDIVSRTIAQDQGLSAKLLQLVNSSYFGPARPMSSLRQATGYVGLSRLRHLVLGVEVFGNSRQCGLASPEEVEERQRHAVLVARIAAEVIADHSDSDAAFTAALLHDIGDLVLARQMPTVVDATKRLLDQPFQRQRERAEDADRIDMHARVGAHLVAIWGLPSKIVEAVLYHHRPGACGHGEFGLPGIVHVADCLVDMLAANDEAERKRIMQRMLDRNWLETIGCWNRIEQWWERAVALAKEDDLMPVASAS